MANEDILERSKSTNEIIWGVKYDTRLFGMMDIESRTVQGFDVDIAKAITKKILGDNGKQNLLKSLLKLSDSIIEKRKYRCNYCNDDDHR